MGPKIEQRTSTPTRPKLDSQVSHKKHPLSCGVLSIPYRHIRTCFLFHVLPRLFHGATVVGTKTIVQQWSLEGNSWRRIFLRTWWLRYLVFSTKSLGGLLADRNGKWPRLFSGAEKSFFPQADLINLTNERILDKVGSHFSQYITKYKMNSALGRKKEEEKVFSVSISIAMCDTITS